MNVKSVVFNHLVSYFGWGGILFPNVRCSTFVLKPILVLWSINVATYVPGNDIIDESFNQGRIWRGRPPLHYFKYDFFYIKILYRGAWNIWNTSYNLKYIYIYTNRIWNICIPPRFSIREKPSPTPNLRSALDIIHMVPTLFPKRNSRTFQGQNCIFQALSNRYLVYCKRGFVRWNNLPYI